MSSSKQIEQKITEIYSEMKGEVLDVRTFVKSRSRNWLIAAGVALLIITILFITVFRSKGQLNEDYKSKINALDSTIKYQQKYIDALQLTNNVQDSTIERLNAAYKNNRPIETRIIHEYEKIPNTVNSLSRDQLRTEVTNY